MRKAVRFGLWEGLYAPTIYGAENGLGIKPLTAQPIASKNPVFSSALIRSLAHSRDSRVGLGSARFSFFGCFGCFVVPRLGGCNFSSVFRGASAYAPGNVQVSFIIPLFNCLSLTQAMLASLQATLPAGLTYEIIYVDDGSTDDTRAWLATLREPPFRVVLNEKNLGYAGANNRAAQLARGDLLILLNNDLILTPRWLEPMLAAHAALGQRAGIVGNVQLDARTGAIDHTGILINLTGKPEHARTLPTGRDRPASGLRGVPAVTGACLLIARTLWQELGGFDEGFVNGGEDVDLCYRARAAGRDTVVALDSVIRHYVSSSAGRKLRDEQNSHRLVLRWREEFIATADDVVARWPQLYLAATLPRIHRSDTPLVCHALLYLLGVMRDPPPQAIDEIKAGQARELARWDEMFNGRPYVDPSPPPPVI